MIVNLPFPGFYGSWYSDALDSAQDRESEYFAERERAASDNEYYQPEQLRLDAAEYGDIFFYKSDYSAAYLRVAQWACDALDLWCADNIGTARESFKFESMSSPREYNFETDRLFAEVDESVMASLLARSASHDSHATFASVIAERFTSRSGFCSFYSNDLADWLAKPLADYDHNELGTLLIAAIQTGDDYDADNWEFELFESAMGDSGDSEAFSDCVDWAAFDAAVIEARAVKFANWIRDDSDAVRCHIERDSSARELLSAALDELDSSERVGWCEASDRYAESHYRCPLTRDLFEGVRL